MPSLREIEVMVRESPEKRYIYSIKRIADNNTLWVIGKEDGLGTYSDDNGGMVFPIWSAQEYAIKCCECEYANYAPEEMELSDFLDNYIHNINDSSGTVAVFPLSTGLGIIVEPSKIKEDLEAELSKY